MKFKILFIEVIAICVLLSSCSSTSSIVDNKDKNVVFNNLNSFDVCELTHCFKNEDVSIQVNPAGDRMYLSITNNTKSRIIVHFESARVHVIGTNKTSRIVTFDQTKQSTSHFSITGVVVNPGDTYKEKYVALDAMTFDVYKSRRYLISEWASINSFKMYLSYGIATKDGEILTDIVIQ